MLEQFATKMTGLPGGLADIIAKQLERQMSGAQPADPEHRLPQTSTGRARPAARAGPAAGRVREPPRRRRARRRGRERHPGAFMIAQAAHETGWGRREIRNADGTASNNLFGIKAGPSWKGAVAEVTTTEYVNGEAREGDREVRAYASAAELRRLREADEDQPALHRRREQRRQRARRASRRACRTPATPPTRPTPTSWRARSTPRCACSGP